MKEIQLYKNGFVTDRAERLYFVLNKFHYLEDIREQGKTFGFSKNGGKVEPWQYMEKGVRSVIVSLREDLKEAGEEKLATEIIVFDKKCHTVEVPEVFRKAYEGKRTI